MNTNLKVPSCPPNSITAISCICCKIQTDMLRGGTLLAPTSGTLYSKFPQKVKIVIVVICYISVFKYTCILKFDECLLVTCILLCKTLIHEVNLYLDFESFAVKVFLYDRRLYNNPRVSKVQDIWLCSISYKMSDLTFIYLFSKNITSLLKRVFSC